MVKTRRVERDTDAHKHSYCHREEGETSDSLRPAALLLVDDRKRREVKVKDRKDDGRVEREKEDDRFAELQQRRTLCVSASEPALPFEDEERCGGDARGTRKAV